jgi:hypothetical protein
MKKILLGLSILCSSFIIKKVAPIFVAATAITEVVSGQAYNIIVNNPTATSAIRKTTAPNDTIAVYKANTLEWWAGNLWMKQFAHPHTDGLPTTNAAMNWIDANGYQKTTPMITMLYPNGPIMQSDSAVAAIASINAAIALKYNASNPSNYIDNNTSSLANYYTKTLGDTRYLQSYTETDPQFDTKFAAKTTNDLAENINLYWTNARGDARYPQLTGSYGNPAWITALAYSKLSGAPTVVSSFTNDAGYLASITSGNVTTALGYTPVTNARTININGTTQDLSANRTWTLAKGDIGLGNVDNTTDANKPVSTATQTALDLKQNVITTGTTGQYIRGDLSLATFPTLYTPNYTAYEAIVTQSGGSAPSAVRKDANFGATTFTWARSLAGQYTVTASTPTFTAGKTVVITSLEANGLQKYTAAVTSTTVVTFNSTVQSVITLILSLTGTDGLFTNTLVEIRIYN